MRQCSVSTDTGCTCQGESAGNVCCKKNSKYESCRGSKWTVDDVCVGGRYGTGTI